ncbi:uncharacterized protein LOC144175058 [Haemaphysalis longicornis]
MACSSLPARALQNYQHPNPAAPARAWRHHQHAPSTVLAVKEHAAEKHHFQLLTTAPDDRSSAAGEPAEAARCSLPPPAWPRESAVSGHFAATGHHGCTAT